METISIFKHTPIVTDVDVPGQTALVLTFDCGCNLDCYACHYFKTRHQLEKSILMTVLPKINNILKTGIVDCIVLNGGEFLYNYKLVKILKVLKVFNKHSIVINTNGLATNRIKYILNTMKNVTFHLDVKSAPSINLTDIKKTLGNRTDPSYYIEQLSKTLDILYADDKNRNHILRTVRYPFLSKEDFSKIETFVNGYKLKYNRKLIWTINDFYKERD